MRIKFSNTEAEATIIPESHADIEELIELFGQDKYMNIAIKPSYKIHGEIDFSEDV